MTYMGPCHFCLHGPLSQLKKKITHSVLRRHYVCVCVCVCVYQIASVVFDSATSWTVAHQAPLSMGFSRQEYWSGLPLPSPRDLPNPGIEPGSLTSPALVAAIKMSMSQTVLGIYFLLILNEVRPFHGSLQWSSSSSGSPCWCVSGRPLTGVEMYEGGPDLGPGL